LVVATWGRGFTIQLHDEWLSFSLHRDNPLSTTIKIGKSVFMTRLPVLRMGDHDSKSLISSYRGKNVSLSPVPLVLHAPCSVLVASF